ncbi:MAG TPA: hypothetical protein DCO83_00555 [Mucilaginibacter sp.]|nr:hypothetical protein [Mucilaginibacter sp.]
MSTISIPLQLIRDIPSLAAYPGSTVNVFNRYGILVYNFIGYAKAWDGNYEGKPLPGPVTILR